VSETAIQCPGCGSKISLTQALSTEIKEQYRKESLQQFSKREAELLNREQALNQKQSEWKKAFQERLKVERAQLEQKIREELTDKSRLEIEDIKAELVEKKKRIEEFQAAELELRKERRKLEEKQQSVELDFQRKLDAERIRIQEETARKIAEENRLKAAEKDKQLEDMLRQIEDLKRKAEQGSQQIQGEVLELEIEAILKDLFPADIIEPVPKGIRGGDIIHKITTLSGQHAGTIIWETKRTKTWSDGWINKLKDDQRAISAECAVIITQVMPKDITALGFLDGVWVADFVTFRGIALSLRFNLLQVFQARAMTEGKNEKLDFLYSYLTGAQFKQRVEAIVEAFRTMQGDLETEKRVIKKNWEAREKQITRVLDSTVRMYGDVQGIIGASLPKIEALEFHEFREEKG